MDNIQRLRSNPYTIIAPLIIRASNALDGNVDRSNVSVLNINKINIDKKIHTASLLGPDDLITAFTKPCMVKGILSTSTSTFILLNLRKYMNSTNKANTKELALKNI